MDHKVNTSYSLYPSFFKKKLNILAARDFVSTLLREFMLKISEISQTEKNKHEEQSK